VIAMPALKTSTPLHLPLSRDGFMRTASNSSSSSATTIGSPSIRRVAGQEAPRSSRDRSTEVSGDQSGRFEREFSVDEEMGQGEFGTVFKVRDDLDCVYAIKKSKRFEGPRHR
jgi:hypothetical protein